MNICPHGFWIGNGYGDTVECLRCERDTLSAQLDAAHARGAALVVELAALQSVVNGLPGCDTPRSPQDVMDAVAQLVQFNRVLDQRDGYREAAKRLAKCFRGFHSTEIEALRQAAFMCCSGAAWGGHHDCQCPVYQAEQVIAQLRATLEQTQSALAQADEAIAQAGLALALRTKGGAA